MTTQELDKWFWNKSKDYPTKQSARTWWMRLTPAQKLAHYNENK